MAACGRCSGEERRMDYVMKEVPGMLHRRLVLLVGTSRHVGFRRDRIVWQKSVPKQQAWRVVLAEVDSTNSVFFFGYLPTGPSDEQLAQWVDACLRACVADQISVGPKEIDISRKLLGDNPRTVAALASQSLKVVCTTDSFDAGVHHAAEAADEVLGHYMWEAAFNQLPPMRAPEGWIDEGMPPLAGVSGRSDEVGLLFLQNFLRRHLRFHGLDPETVDERLPRQKARLAAPRKQSRR
ncbi:hypothetical protein BZM27_42875 [Paraburkholderia steynii]|uniref:Uncharacterized protein n=1 Tax=Paraburkholderia steynii TaxID=1245441 RepID=A0A4R0X9B7_9BURK|nr:hypothetical protein BZM27_42875 [Paraburkholderia steynii]